MKLLRYRVCLLALLALVSGAAFATTYTFTGKPFTQIATAPYTSAMAISGTFDTVAPLPANLAWTSSGIGPTGSNLVTAWAFTDGVRTYTDQNSNATWFSIGTDAFGNINMFTIFLLAPKATLQTPHTVNQVITELGLQYNQPDEVLQFTCAGVNANTGVCSASMNLVNLAIAAGNGGTGSFSGPAAAPVTLTAAPSPLQFGDQLVGTMSTKHTVTVTASGGTVNFIQGQAVTITNPDFTLGVGPNSCNDPWGKWSLAFLADGASCTLDVFFTPSATGPRSGQMIFPSTNASSPEIVLLGNGTKAPPPTAASVPALSTEALAVLLFAMILGAVFMHTDRNPLRFRR